ncbi:MAG: methylmalonyl-CoA mutase family protein [Gammaproteobacteria bacterium]|nr:methylmalonyl-CoA mutase family protein [Gammaproteobacteria bacterium]
MDEISPTPLRFVTAASLFDGHDAAINIIRRLLVQKGAEVVHLGHDRSVDEIVTAAIDEDAHGIAVSSYQGGHIEFFSYMIDLLKERGASHIKVFAGGGGVIVADEIEQLQAYGVCRIYSPHDGQALGLEGMIDDMLARATAKYKGAPAGLFTKSREDRAALSRLITLVELGKASSELLDWTESVPVLGITGTGGAGKSSLTDELIRRFRIDQQDKLKIALLAVDPTRRKTGGALLGDRIRMNANSHPNIYVRSLATRQGGVELSDAVPQAIQCCAAADFDLVIVETAGIGQGDAAISELADVSLYVMTPEFGAATQLEKIDMLDFADVVAINKFDRRGAEDALRDVRKQMQRNQAAFTQAPEDMPVFGTIASQFNDRGVTALYQYLKSALTERGLTLDEARLEAESDNHSSQSAALIPTGQQRYLADIAETVRKYHAVTVEQADLAEQYQQLCAAQSLAGVDLSSAIADIERQLSDSSKALLEAWPALESDYSGEQYISIVRGREVPHELKTKSLSGTDISRISLPRYRSKGDLLSWLRREHLPGHFPYTGGVFDFKRENEDPTRMFAGEGGPQQTNARFKYLSEGMDAKRLSTAFDSVTLYGRNPDKRPDIYGKVGNSGVSIATLDDMRELYDGFDLCDPATSVSMTINGPAPTILAMFFNAAIDQQLDKFEQAQGRQASAQERQAISAKTLNTVRGTVQADILKEDQGQNTCIFSTEFSLRCMGDMQQYFIEQEVRNFYSVSISGYHIAEAGANPISQLAFTLANGFTYVEAYLARGMDIDEFAPNLSFFFSNGMDPEYSVLGRVARRIWAVAMRDRYGANERSQKLKYHIQTSGRSLHAQEIAFNDIRTTLQALIAVYDHCNSLHTNAYDEAVTTPTEESVRRALAIQQIINHEWGVAKCENPNQGSFYIEELTDLVEEAVLSEFERINQRGGVLGAMETGYQRGKIQDESMHYEHLKHTGELPIVGVNAFLGKDEEKAEQPIPLVRSSEDVRDDQIDRLQAFHQQHADESKAALMQLQTVCLEGGNIFAELMNAVRYCSLGQITECLFHVGGQYRRNM